MAVEEGAGAKRKRAPTRAWGKANQACDWLIRLINNTPVFRLIALVGALVGFVILVGSAWQIWNDYIDRREDRIDRAWNRLLRPLAGNSGKADAFEYLINSGLSLSGANLSCRALGNFDATGNRCAMAPIFQDLDIGKPDGDMGLFEAIDFSGVSFKNLTLTNVHLKKLNFDGVSIDGLVAADSFVNVTGTANVMNCAFPGSAVPDSLFSRYDSYCDFSNTLFTGFYQTPDLKGWAWADTPPYIVIEEETTLKPMVRANIRPWTEAIGDLEITLCAVPVGENGQAIPYNERKREGSCEQISLDDARNLYPDKYAESRLGGGVNADPRWSGGLQGRIIVSMRPF